MWSFLASTSSPRTLPLNPRPSAQPAVPHARHPPRTPSAPTGIITPLPNGSAQAAPRHRSPCSVGGRRTTCFAQFVVHRKTQRDLFSRFGTKNTVTFDPPLSVTNPLARRTPPPSGQKAHFLVHCPWKGGGYFCSPWRPGSKVCHIKEFSFVALALNPRTPPQTGPGFFLVCLGRQDYKGCHFNVYCALGVGTLGALKLGEAPCGGRQLLPLRARPPVPPRAGAGALGIGLGWPSVFRACYAALFLHVRRV